MGVDKKIVYYSIVLVSTDSRHLVRPAEETRDKYALKFLWMYTDFLFLKSWQKLKNKRKKPLRS